MKSIPYSIIGSTHRKERRATTRYQHSPEEGIEQRATGTQEFGEGRSSGLLVEKRAPDQDSTSSLRFTLKGYPEDDSQKSAAFFISMVILALTMTAVAARVHFSS